MEICILSVKQFLAMGLASAICSFVWFVDEATGFEEVAGDDVASNEEMESGHVPNGDRVDYASAKTIESIA